MHYASSRSPSLLASETPIRGGAEPVAEHGAEQSPEERDAMVTQPKRSAEVDTMDSEKD
jgi:hypothetical protein